MFQEEQCDTDSEVESIGSEFEDIHLFLHGIGEPHLVDLFIDNNVTLGQLLEMDEQDLINCGVELVGDRKKILESVGQMHCEEWSPSSLHDLTLKSHLSSPGIYISINDINKHLDYLGAALRFIKSHVQKNPAIMELGKDFVGVAKVYSELNDLIITSETTHTAIIALKNTVAQLANDPTLKPANHIDASYLSRAKRPIRAVSVLVATFLIFASIKFIKPVFLRL